MPETRRPVLARRGEPECQAEQDTSAGMLLCWLPDGHDGDHFDTYDGWWNGHD